MKKTAQAQIVIPPGFAISCGDNSDKCGSLWQVDFITGKATTRIDPNECDLNTPCPVTDPLSRVRFIPNLGGHDPAGPNGDASREIDLNDNDNDNVFIFNHKHDKYYTKLAPALPIYGHRRGRPRARGTNGILSAAALRGRIY